MGKGTSDYLLEVIWITVWIMWIQGARSVSVQDNSKSDSTDFDEIFRICLKR